MKNFVRVLIRIISMYYFLATFRAIGSVVSYIPIMMNMELGTRNEGVLSLGIQVLFNFIICILVWIFSDKIADFITGERSEVNGLSIDLNYKQALMISMKIVGIILIIISIEEGAYEIVKVIGINMNRYNITESAVMLMQLLFPFIKIMIGTLLIVSKKIHQLIGLDEAMVSGN